MILALIIGGVWIVGILFFLALFKAAARGDRMFEEFNDEDVEDIS